MKKLLLTLGAVASVAAPVAAVVACSSDSNADKAIEAQKAAITASNAPQDLKDAALAELAKVKDAAGLAAFYKTVAFKTYQAAVPTAQTGAVAATGKTVESLVTEGTLEFRADASIGNTHIATAEEKTKIGEELAKLTYVGTAKHLNIGTNDGDERFFFTGASDYLAGLSNDASTEGKDGSKTLFGFDAVAKKVTFFLEKYETSDDASSWAEHSGTNKVAYTLQAVVGDKIKSVLAWIK